ncbi:unnamed protein product [Coffea canephora]|uniref:Agenet domain-containing protein n=1 Tax=Coffea canephora TaxID=49390 RepID=A0A068V7S3_COFCA|nr:unnamed protein product [Coffea canephora]
MTKDKTQFFKEADISCIKPSPPKIHQVEPFEVYTQVDAWYNNGWWVGLISKVLRNFKYVTYFKTSNEEMEFGHYDLQPHQEWIRGKWIIASKKKSKLGKLRGQIGVVLAPCFCSGMKIEVKK